MKSPIKLTQNDIENLLSDKNALEREACSRSLVFFIQRAWHVLEPNTDFLHGWHLDAICEHLEAITKGQITRLLINVPPGTMKSLAVNVFWPAWEWGPCKLAHHKVLSASHERELAIRDNTRMRTLIKSDWYQRLWPIKLKNDQDEKTKFENVYMGFRQASSVASMTGHRGNRVIWDDPHTVEKAESETARETTLRIFRETLSNRLVDPKKSSIIVIMQRLHQYDVSGYIIASGLDYVHLCLPMEFDPSRRCTTVIGFEDPRKEEGELLFPSRFPREVVEKDKMALGSHAYASQNQQLPTPRGGGNFKDSWWKHIDKVPSEVYLKGKCVRFWDLASTEQNRKNDPDYTAGVKMWFYNGVYYLEDVVRFRASPAFVEEKIKATARADGIKCSVRQEVEGGSSGKIVTDHYARNVLSGYDFKGIRDTRSKTERSRLMEVAAENGLIYIVEGSWNRAFLDEAGVYPNGKHDDQIDAASSAFNCIASYIRQNNVIHITALPKQVR